MKKQRKQARRRAQKQPIFTLSSAANNFVRGFVSYAAVAALAGGNKADGKDDHRANLPIFDRALLKRATLTGAALVAGAAAGKAAKRGNYLSAALTAVGGVAGVYALDRLLEQAFQQEE
jgi:hypothetical protein